MSDIRLDDGPEDQVDGWVTVETHVLNVHGSTLILDEPGRRKKNAGYRRALVHNENDGITINYDDDYPDGVTILGARIRLKPMEQDSVTDPKLPAIADMGDLVFVHATTKGLGAEIGSGECALWICVGAFRRGRDAHWPRAPSGR